MLLEGKTVVVTGVGGGLGRECVTSAESVLALEVLAAAQALDLRGPLRPGQGTAAALDAVREVVAHLRSDRELGPDIAAARELVTSGRMVEAVEAAAGSLS